MMRVNKRAAAFLGAVTIAGGAGLTVLAPAATAATVTAQAKCQVPVLGEKTGPQDISVTLTPTAGPAGIEVTANVDLGPPPITAPAEFKDSTAQSTLHLEMSGAATGTVDLVGPVVELTIPANVPIDPEPYTTTFTVPASATVDGTITFTPKGSTNVTVLPGLGKQTAPCTYTSDAVATYDVKPAAAQPGTVVVAETSVEPGATVTVSGENWTAPLGKVQLCDASNACKDITGVTRSEADNKIAGTPTIPADTAGGKYKIKVAYADGVSALSNEFSVTAPAITLDPVEGPVDTKVKVTGKDFPAGKPVEVVGLKGDAPTEDKASGTVKDDGTFSVDLTVKNKDTTKIKATADGKSAVANFKVTSDPDPTDPPTTSPPPVIKDPNGKPVEVKYSCLTADSPIDSAKGPFEATREITILLPSAGDPNEEVDVSASFKDDVVGDMPNIPVPNVQLTITPTLDIKVTDDAGGTGKITLTAASPPPIPLEPGKPMKAGPFTGKFKIPGGGLFSFFPGELRITTATNIVPQPTHTVCTLKNDPAASATLKAEGARGQLPSSNGGTTSGTTGGNGAASGDLAKTGSGGSTLGAFALVAGTTVLASVGVLLLITRRRRAVAGS
ncbi:hypothetical protein [Yinghuangia sp. YIM S09857]|uniref:hypothetical protein n=1 Tax=Yinghuangia sp. YIM S09857 TaxID=3436929 RepID=UPI003F5318ED